MTQQQQAPSHQSESIFRKYEPAIARITEQYPNIVVLEPNPDLAFITYISRLRDSIRSLAKYQWKTKINLAHFLSIQKKIVCAHRGSTVVCGSREMIKLYDQGLTVKFTMKEKQIEPKVFELSKDSIAANFEYKLLMQLFKSKWFTFPVEIKNITEEQIPEMLELLLSLDIAFLENENSITILP